MRVAVAGMGKMGRALAERLLAREFPVTVWNRTPGRAAELIDLGAVEVASPGEAARSAEVVLLSLADDQAVQDVLAGMRGEWADGAIVVDMSTVAPATSRASLDMTPGRRFVAAPIAGGPSAVAGGQATALVGGARDLVDALAPVWSQVFGSYSYCGPDPGHATAFKLMNNYMLLSGIAVLAEVTAASRSAGLDPGLLRDFLLSWPTVAPGLHNRVDDILDGDHSGWFTTRLGTKDVRLAAELAEAGGLELPIARMVEQRYAEAADRGWSEADVGAVVELLQADPR